MTQQTDGWRCEKCGEKIIFHGLSRWGRLVCPQKCEPLADGETLGEMK